MASLNSADLIGSAQKIVIKIGSALLVENGALRLEWLRGLASDVAKLKAQGKDVVLVSSGSIALGRAMLGLGAGVLTLDKSQAAAAVGQINLAQAYQNVLQVHEINAAQVLLTLEDSRNRRRYLNTRATLGALLAMGVVPIVNENDTIATDEIRYGDNDRLAAQAASLIGADVLVLLSDIDGLYASDPREDSNARHIALVGEITPEIEAMAGGVGSAGASGGMKTKLMAAKIAMKAGCAMVIVEGIENPVSALIEGARCTWFKAENNPAQARKLWISAMKPVGTLIIDVGAVAALSRGKSLLSAGVVRVEGVFERGDPVDISAQNGDVIAKGLVGYSNIEAKKLVGCQSSEIEKRLGYPGRAALIHRDDMAI
ncbi:MAG: glutamate 5-kinase [Rhodobacteraceae bacterium]|nr:glutamate 5-kinase [Paracoccaceae bacterium]